MSSDQNGNCFNEDRIRSMERELAETSTLIREMSKRFSEIIEETHEMQKRQDAFMFGTEDKPGIKTDIFLLKQEESKRQKMNQTMFRTMIGCVVSFVGLIISNLIEKIK